MKTTTQKNKHVRFWMLNIIMLTAIATNAETTNKFTTRIKESFSGDGLIGVYVVFGILSVGIIGSIIISKLDKAKKTDSEMRESKKSISHRHHHSHHIIKKSA